MAVLEVERIPAPTGKIFRQDYFAQQRPVILQGLFAGQKIDEIRSEEDAAKVFGGIQLPVQNEYLTAMAETNGQPPPPETMSLADYLAFIRERPGTRRMCSEKPTPGEMLATFQLPPYDRYDDAISSFFVGNRGNFAHLHYDGDHRHVLFHQVFGTKRFILIPPSEGRKLNPVGNYAYWSIENFTQADKLKFVDWVNGYDCVLHAGETLYMPAGIWHYVEYVSTSMSYSLRFGRNSYTRFLSRAFHMNLFLQNIAWKMSNATVAREKYGDVFREIVAANDVMYGTAEEKYNAMDALFRRIAADICPELPVGEYGAPDSARLSDVYKSASEQLYRPLEKAALAGV